MELLSVECQEDEDWYGDEFYIISIAGPSTGDRFRRVVLPKIDIDNDEVHSIVDPRRIVFNFMLKPDQYTLAEMRAYDRDTEGWKYADGLLEDTALSQSGPGTSVQRDDELQPYLNGVLTALDLPQSDDLLGYRALTILPDGPTVEDGKWELREGGSSYTVNYQIVRTRQ